MIDLIQLAAQIGGVGGLIATLIFLMYRRDRNATEKMWRDSKKFTEDRLSALLEKDQETREDNTKAITELITYLKLQNGRRP